MPLFEKSFKTFTIKPISTTAGETELILILSR